MFNFPIPRERWLGRGLAGGGVKVGMGEHGDGSGRWERTAENVGARRSVGR